jgi:hypothetical protein
LTFGHPAIDYISPAVYPAPDKKRGNDMSEQQTEQTKQPESRPKENDFEFSCGNCGEPVHRGAYKDKGEIPLNRDGTPHMTTCSAFKNLNNKDAPKAPPTKQEPLAEDYVEQPKPKKKPKEETKMSNQPQQKPEPDFKTAQEIVDEKPKMKQKPSNTKPTENAIVRQIPSDEQDALLPRFDQFAMQNAISNFQMLSQVLKDNMIRGHHYGKFPGWQKDQLLEPGASLVMNGFKLYADPVRMDRVESDEGHYRMHITVYLRPIGRNDLVIASGVGSASTREVKYAYRWLKENQLPTDIDKESLF